MRARHLLASLLVALAAARCASSAPTGTFSVLVQFTGTGGTASGVNPAGSLRLVGSALYGMTSQGGINGFGNVFKVGLDGTNYQNVLSFTGSGGAAVGQGPHGSLTVVGTNLYGMTPLAGNVGNVFRVGSDGTNYQNLVSFTVASGTAMGQYPNDSLTLVGSNLYGMTQAGGAFLYGVLFSVGSNGANYQNLLSFAGHLGPPMGDTPYGSLTLSGTTLYGMTSQGSTSAIGNIFSVGTNGTGYQSLVSFTGSGGAAPGWQPELGSLALGGTRLYGMTVYGRAGQYGNVFSVGTNGTGFQNLLSFTGSGGIASGANPIGSLILSGTALYGMTSKGGVHGFGNLFSVGVNGSGYQDLYDFTGGANGASPAADLLLSGGTLFGMTSKGGIGPNGGYGTVFAYTLPVPEPGTLALFGTGAAAVAAYRWRRRRRRAPKGRRFTQRRATPW